MAKMLLCSLQERNKKLFGEQRIFNNPLLLYFLEEFLVFDNLRSIDFSLKENKPEGKNTPDSGIIFQF